MVYKIEVALVDDRVEIAGILAKNGYKVWIGKERQGTSKSYKYYVYYESKDGEVDM